MISSAEKHTQLTLPITLTMHQVAGQFYQHHTPGLKAQRVYLNTLAILVVNSYFQMMGIETDLSTADSWQIPIQMLSDVADLRIRNQGAVECRPVLPNADTCYIPAESWENRLGFIAVQFDNLLNEATILGFLPVVQEESIPIGNWSPIEQLLHVINPQPIRLLQWLQDQVESGWSTIEELISPKQTTWQFRSTQQMATTLTENEAPVAYRGKVLNLSTTQDPIALVVGLQQTEQADIEVWAKVFSLGKLERLPGDLELQVFDASNVVVMQAQARGTASIQVKFSGNVGEIFSICLMLDGSSWVEKFVL